MNKKGFTLIEVIAAVVVMVAILLIVVPTFRAMISRNTLKIWKENEHRLEDAATKYLSEKGITIEEGYTLTITKQQLITAGLINEVYNITDKNNICDARVEVQKTSGKYIEKAYITCPNGYITE
jgi:prepilin-type N-terminal cleavage/methylation domain-containing protein